MSQRKIKKTEKRSKELDPSQDKFVNKSVSFLDWVYERRRPIGLLIFLALGSSVGGIFINRFLDERNATSSQVIADGLEASSAPVVPPISESDTPDVPPKEEEDELLTFDSSKARATEMLSRWKKATKEADADLKVVSELGVATAHFELGEFGKAAQAYEAFLKNKNPGLAWLRPVAIEGLGYALEASGKLKEARTKFETLMGESQGEAKRNATYQAGRIAQLTKDTEGAKKLFKQVLDSYTELDKPSRFDLVFVQARTRLLALDPKAEVPDLPAGGMGAFDGMDPRILRQLMQAQQGAGAS
jgi:tetratricopeptide (TPR) repeat protein